MDDVDNLVREYVRHAEWDSLVENGHFLEDPFLFSTSYELQRSDKKHSQDDLVENTNFLDEDFLFSTSYELKRLRDEDNAFMEDTNFLDDDYLFATSYVLKGLFMKHDESDMYMKHSEENTKKPPADNPDYKYSLMLPAVPSKKLKKSDGWKVSKFIPGFNQNTDFPTDFPRFSELNVQEQAAFLDLSKRLTPDRLPFAEQKDLRLYMELIHRVQMEQKEYLRFAREKNLHHPFEYGMMNYKTKQYIEAALKQRQMSVPYNYARLYHHLAHIPLTMIYPTQNQPVEMVAIQELLSLGSVAHFDAQKFDGKTVLLTSSDLVEQHFPASGVPSPRLLQEVPPGEKLLYHTPVSEDGNAVALAIQHDADIVVSSSILQLLIDCHPNHPQNCATPRDVPVIVKMVPTPNGGQKRVVFLDKALPPVEMTMHDKKTWYCKRAIRAFFNNSDKRIFDFASNQEVVIPAKLEPKQEPESTAVSDTKSSELEEPRACQALKNTSAKAVQQLPQKMQRKGRHSYRGLTSAQSTLEERDTKKKKKKKSTKQGGADKVEDDLASLKVTPCLSPHPEQPEQPPDLARRPAPNHNVVYGLWSLRHKEAQEGASSVWWRPNAELKMVVRTSYHGYEWDKETGRRVLLHTSLKLEHQPQYGAQMTTVGEVAREWMAMYLRPNSVLYRVRVNAYTNEVIQMQRLGIGDLVCEARDRSLNLEHCLGALHQVLGLLSRAEPATYLLKLCPCEGRGQIIQQDCSGTTLRGGSFFSLHLAYRKARTDVGPSSHVPYSPIDRDLQTPYQKHYNRMSAMFEPSDFRLTKKKSKKLKPKKR